MEDPVKEGKKKREEGKSEGGREGVGSLVLYLVLEEMF